MLSTIKSTFYAHEKSFMILCGSIFIAIIAFTGGLFYGVKWQQKPLIIEKKDTLETLSEAQNDDVEDFKKNDVYDSTENTKTQQVQATCIFVGSKGGSKYYPPGCSFAARIKPENLRCFRSEEEAVQKGYAPTTAC